MNSCPVVQSYNLEILILISTYMESCEISGKLHSIALYRQEVHHNFSMFGAAEGPK